MITAKQLALKHGMMSVAEVDLFQRFARKISTPDVQQVFVNIGSGAGTSVLALREVIPSDAYIFSIDKKGHDLELKYLKEAGFTEGRFTQQIKVRSQDLGPIWKREIDFLFIDGDHTEAGVLGDIEAWVPHVIPEGIIAFHDYDHLNVPHLKTIVDREMKKRSCPFLGKTRYLAIFEQNKYHDVT